jgi:NADP-dependent 3-hydroxy acid dehydrogenase YdfG
MAKTVLITGCSSGFGKLTAKIPVRLLDHIEELLKPKE